MNTYHNALELAKRNDSSWVAKLIVKRNVISFVDMVTQLNIHNHRSLSHQKCASFPL